MLSMKILFSKLLTGICINSTISRWYVMISRHYVHFIGIITEFFILPK